MSKINIGLLSNSFTIADNSYENEVFNISALDFLDYNEEYLKLPSEYDIFENIYIKFGENPNTKSETLLRNCLDYFKIKVVQAIWSKNSPVRLPKLFLKYDKNDESYMVDWIFRHKSFYISIEKDVESSFYGVIYEDECGTYIQKTASINFQNYKHCIDEIFEIAL